MANYNLEQPIHSVQKLALYAELLADQGLPVPALLDGSGIEPGALCQDSTRVSYRQMLRVFNNVRTLTRDPAVGLRAGGRVHISTYGIYGYALLSSLTARDAIELAVRYHGIAAPCFELKLRIEQGIAVLSFRDFLDLGELLPMLLEFQFSLVMSLCREVAGDDFRPLEIHAACPAPAHADSCRALFGCPIRFDAPHSEFRFDARYLDREPPQANPITNQMCIQMCDRILSETGGHGGVAGEVLSLILRKPGRFPTIETVADALHASPRTLRRRLSAEGTSYQQLLNDARMRLACEYLGKTRMTVDEIAERTGYSDAANFRHAFKRWTGRTPGQYRAAADNSDPT